MGTDEALVQLILRQAGLSPEEEASWRLTGEPMLHFTHGPEEAGGRPSLWIVAPQDDGSWRAAPLALEGPAKDPTQLILPVVLDILTAACGIPVYAFESDSIAGHCARWRGITRFRAVGLL